MKVHVHSIYHRYHRVLVLQPLDGESRGIKLHGDPMKALALVVLFGHKAEPPPRRKGGFVVDLTEEEWRVLRVISKQCLTWKKVASEGLIQNPTFEKVKSFLCIEKVVG